MTDTVKDSTPTAVTVSDQMRALVIRVINETRDNDHLRTSDGERDDNYQVLLQEIATLEAKVETTERVLGDRINELLVQVAALPDPAEERLELPCVKCGGQAACWCDRPQTLEEAMSEVKLDTRYTTITLPASVERTPEAISSYLGAQADAVLHAVAVTGATPEIRRWKLFRNNVSMLARRIRKYQRYGLLDDLIQLCEAHGAHADMLRNHEDLGGYAPQTAEEEPEVSRPMADLLDAFYSKVRIDAMSNGKPAWVREEKEKASNALWRAISTLESDRDFMDKDRDRLTLEVIALEAKVEFLGRVAADTPAEERREDVLREIYPPDDAAPCLPQTLEEEIPEGDLKRVEYTIDELGKDRTPPKPEVLWMAITLQCALKDLRDIKVDRSRLLTALEEKEKELQMFQGVVTALGETTHDDFQTIQALQSASVLQKEELSERAITKCKLCGGCYLEGHPHLCATTNGA